MMHRFRKSSYLALTCLLVASIAQAGLLPISVNVTKDGNASNWAYSVVLTSDVKLQKGDFFTIYDFAGFLSSTNDQPDSFSFGSSLTGPTPGRVNPNDDPNLPNLTWTYTGDETTVGPANLGTFQVQSLYGASESGFFTSLTRKTIDGKTESNITDTLIPVPMENCGVPEPTTLILLGAGLPMLGLARWVRGRRETTV
jgi:hypothetical protein